MTAGSATSLDMCMFFFEGRRERTNPRGIARNVTNREQKNAFDIRFIISPRSFFPENDAISVHSPKPSTTKFCEKLKNPATAISNPANAASFAEGE